MTLEQKIQDCKDYAGQIVAEAPFAKTIQFEIQGVSWEDFKRVTNERDRFKTAGSKMSAIVYGPGCQIGLFTVPLKIVTSYEIIETPKAEAI